MQRRFLPPVLLLLAALLWSLGGVLIKSIDWHPMGIAAGRSAIAIPVMLLCIGRPRFTFSRAQVGGAIGYAATVVLFVFATRMTTAANAIFLQYTAPIYVAIIGRWYLSERALPIEVRRDFVLIVADRIEYREWNSSITLPLLGGRGVVRTAAGARHFDAAASGHRCIGGSHLVAGSDRVNLSVRQLRRASRIVDRCAGHPTLRQA